MFDVSFIVIDTDTKHGYVCATSSVMMIYTHSNTMILNKMKSIILGSKIDIRIILTLDEISSYIFNWSIVE